jgi:hypothetical protein
VHDAALAILKSLEAALPLVREQIFSVGSNEQNYTISQVGEIINRLLPEAQLLDLGSDGDRRNYRVDFSKIRNTLDYKPEWTVEQGVLQVIAAMESGKVKDYRNAKFSNVKFLSDEGAYRLVRQNGWAHELIKEACPQLAVAAGD